MDIVLNYIENNPELVGGYLIIPEAAEEHRKWFLEEHKDIRIDIVSKLVVFQQDVTFRRQYITSTLTLKDTDTGKLYQIYGGHESEQYMQSFEWCRFIGEVEINPDIQPKYSFRKKEKK